jgi:hypothetical protein
MTREAQPLMRRAFLFIAWSCAAGCRSQSSSLGDASAARSVTVHVPGALRVARAIDLLSVEIDPSSRADVEVSVDPGMSLAVETESQVFVAGESIAKARTLSGRASGGDFDVGVATWSTALDGVPQLDKKYVVEMRLVLFETDLPLAHDSDRDADAHGAHLKTLLTRTLRQAEE